MSAYVIVELDVHDAEKFAKYRELVPPTIEQYGGRYLVRGGEYDTIEGDWQPPRVVVLEFDDRAAARRWYDSPEYAGPKKLRLEAARSKAVIVDGL